MKYIYKTILLQLIKIDSRFLMKEIMNNLILPKRVIILSLNERIKEWVFKFSKHMN
jgi:hypothetical protein